MSETTGGFPKQASGTSDLYAARARHGITTSERETYVSAARWEAWFVWDLNTVAAGATEADAVVGLLKARYRIGTVAKDEGQSDFAAVVALADRLRGAE